MTFSINDYILCVDPNMENIIYKSYIRAFKENGEMLIKDQMNYDIKFDIVQSNLQQENIIPKKHVIKKVTKDFTFDDFKEKYPEHYL